MPSARFQDHDTRVETGVADLNFEAINCVQIREASGVHGISYWVTIACYGEGRTGRRHHYRRHSALSQVSQD